VNERTILFAGALTSLALVLGLLVPTPQQDPGARSLPTSADRGALGLAGARAWLDARGVPTKSLRVRYDGLQKLAGPKTGNLLILHLPRLRTARPDELQALRAWLKEGNTAVVLAALAHRPRWLRDRAEPLSQGLEQLELALEPVNADDEARQATSANGDGEGSAGATITLDALTEHPLLQGVEHLSAAGPAAGLKRAGEGPKPWLALFARQGDPVVWWRRYGAGAMLVSGHPGLLGNDALLRRDNAQLLANLVVQQTAPAGRVIFDDFHVGLSRLYDAEAFFSDGRLHATLGFLAGFWLLYVAGCSNRLAPPVAQASRPSGRALTEAAAGLLARRCKRAAVAQALLAHFFDDVRRRHGLPENAAPAWDCLRERTQVPSELIDRLQSFAQRLDQGRRMPLLRLTHAIARIQEHLR